MCFGSLFVIIAASAAADELKKEPDPVIKARLTVGRVRAAGETPRRTAGGLPPCRLATTRACFLLPTVAVRCRRRYCCFSFLSARSACGARSEPIRRRKNTHLLNPPPQHLSPQPGVVLLHTPRRRRMMINIREFIAASPILYFFLLFELVVV